MEIKRVTRGYGLLEKFLSQQRAKLVDSKIPNHLRKGRILDIGCGLYPLFLINTTFKNKYGLDKVFNKSYIEQFNNETINLTKHNIQSNPKLPFSDEYFNVVTMLAVFEHIDPNALFIVLNEINRILKTGGDFILTIPAPWTDHFLQFMSLFYLVSPIEIAEHKDTYSQKKISKILRKSGFFEEKIQVGYFEIFFNIWVRATK